MHPHAQPPATAALHALLMDLVANGITDLTAENPTSWHTPLTPTNHRHQIISNTHQPLSSNISPQTSDHQQPTTPIKEQTSTEHQSNHLSPTSSSQSTLPTKAARPTFSTEKSIQISPENIFWSFPPQDAAAATLPQHCRIFAGSLPAHFGQNPYTPQEAELLTNMLKSLEVSDHTTHAVTVADAQNRPIPAAALMPHRATWLKAPESKLTLVFGHIAAQLFTGEENTPLSTLRETAQSGKFDKENQKVIITYHPRTLLKQPQLKKLVWQDFCSYLSRIEK